MVQTQEKLPYSALALCLSSTASQGLDSVQPLSAGLTLGTYAGPLKTPWVSFKKCS